MCATQVGNEAYYKIYDKDSKGYMSIIGDYNRKIIFVPLKYLADTFSSYNLEKLKSNDMFMEVIKKKLNLEFIKVPKSEKEKDILKIKELGNGAKHKTA